MTKMLLLIRHAKSDWGDPMQDDHDRPLNARGQANAPRIGAWLAREGLVPDTILCSTARRTRETLEGICAQLPARPATQMLPDLYLGSPTTLLKRLRDAEGGTVALIAHNPGIGALATALAATPPDHPKFGLYPTGATLALRLPISHWSALAPGQGRPTGFVVPRELDDPA